MSRVVKCQFVVNLMASQRASAALNESQTYLKASILPTDFLSEKASDIFGVME